MSKPGSRAVNLDQLPVLPQGVGEHAMGYALGVQARRNKGMPTKYTSPPGGDPAPPMPALEQPFQSGMTMAQQAAMTWGQDAQRNVAQSMANVLQQPGSIVIAEDGPLQPEPTNPSTLIPSLLPTDVLPPEAAQDEQFHRGAGSMLAAHQPHMAAKYGVVRQGVRISPQALHQSRTAPAASPAGPPGARLRRPISETLHDLRRAAEAQRALPVEEEGPQPPPGLPRTEAEAVAQAAQGPGGRTQDIGRSPARTFDEEQEAAAKVQAQVDKLDDFDFDKLRREMMRDVLKNPRQRELVEARCKPLNVNDLIMHNRVAQRVPILPGTFEPTFESVEGDLEITLKGLLVKESKSIMVTEDYLLSKYSLMSLAAGVIAINANPIPSMYDQKGDFNEKLFWAKYKWVAKRNVHMLASLGIHYAWFEERVRKLFVVFEGKDG